jgi:hypothetical protein
MLLFVNQNLCFGEYWMFTQAEDKNNTKTNHVQHLSSHIIEYVLTPMLGKDIIPLASCCSFFKNVLSNKPLRLLSIMLNPTVFKQVLRDNVIQDYHHLSTLLNRTMRIKGEKAKLTLWEVYCLSGELAAIHHVVDHGRVTPPSTCKKPSYYAALSGSIAAVDYLINVLRYEADSELLCYAAGSGSTDMLIHAIKHLSGYPLNEFHFYEALYAAALMGSPETVRCVREQAYIRGINLDPTEEDNRALWCAKTHIDAHRLQHDIIAALHCPILEMQEKLSDSKERNTR